MSLRNVLRGFREIFSGRRRENAPSFVCPICRFEGRFEKVETKLGGRLNAKCPACKSLERHRLQRLVFDRVLKGKDLTSLSVLHFAPEAFMQGMFASAARYVTADLSMPHVDFRFDLQLRSPLQDESFDIVYASHVLEHVRNDTAALKEIARILKPGGFAALPVPVVGEKTIEYPEPNPFEDFHVRAPGRDYYERFGGYFARIEIYTSDQFDPMYQLYIYEDRSIYPTATSPFRVPTAGERHADFVPICYKS